MSKQITPIELLEILGGLLLRPQSVFESITPAQHQLFFRELGEVIANHFGGTVSRVNPPETTFDYLASDESSPTLSVQPDPSPLDWNDVVWRHHDLHGWEDEDLAYNGTSPTQEMASDARLGLMSLMRGSSVPFTLNDASRGCGVISGEMIIDDIGLSLRFDGYSDCSHEMNEGYPLVIENYGQVLYLRAFADINSEEPTHSISLESARNERRIDE